MRIRFLLLLFFPLCLQAQSIKRIGSYQLPPSGSAEKAVIIEMPYGKYEVTGITGDTSGLRTAGEIMIDVVFTDYPAYASLATLNNNRVEQFYRLFPAIQRSRVRAVTFHRQLHGAEKDKAQPMFHGLVILYRPVQNMETMKQDRGKLEEIATPLRAGNTNMPGSPHESISGVVMERQIHKQPYAVFPYDFDTRKNKISENDSILIMSPKEALEYGYISADIYREQRKNEYIKMHFRTRLVKSAVVHPSTQPEKPRFNLPDSTVFRAFTRNRWKNPVITADVTGSMYPYTAQLLAWLQLFSDDTLTTDFVFFNDGDNKPDRDKQTGSTGGIYAAKCTTYQQVKALVHQAMSKGSGGDIPENNIEALIAAEKNFPGRSFHVMIADNWAPVKDMSLLPRISKPVRIILCGVYNNHIHPHYLDIAYATRGSVHLEETDVSGLEKMKEGDVIEIRKKQYRLVNGRFLIYGNDRYIP